VADCRPELLSYVYLHLIISLMGISLLIISRV
ncbi:unnamed protein product, partial [marine sediment metagenome]